MRRPRTAAAATRAVTLTLLLALLAFPGVASAQTIIYVNAAAPAGGNGTSWATAYNDLQAALAATSAAPLLAEIWVAQGTYTPSAMTSPSDPQSATFSLRNRVALFGGFAGNELARADRNVANHTTVLSGGNLYYYHVVLADNVDATAVLDGFTITGGNAPTSGNNLPTGLGGGLCTLAPNSSPTVRNCTFSGNRAYRGAAISLAAPSTARIENCRFLNNVAQDLVGGVRVTRAVDDPAATIVISGCVFSGNSAGRYGACMQIEGQRASVYNCVFTENSSPADPPGGGQGATIELESASLVVRNSIFWNEPGSLVISGYAAGTIDVDYCDIQGGQAKVGAPGGGQIVWGSHNLNSNPLFVGAQDFRIQAGSPCIDAGSNGAIPSGTLTDMLGNFRVFDGNGDGSGDVDIGAFEYGSAPYTPLIYVRQSAIGGNTGLSWADAYSGTLGLKSAIAFVASTNGAVTQIWVAAGTYKPAGFAGSRSASFQLQNNLAIYGGFNGTEALLSQRNIAANPTILSGDLNGDDNGDLNRSDNSYHVVTADSVGPTAIIDGITVIAGAADDNTTTLGPLGGGLIVNLASPQIVGCTFLGNTALQGGACVVRGQGSSPLFSRCSFLNNRASGTGGALLIGLGLPDGQTVIRSSVFQGNAAGSGILVGGRGGALDLIRGNAAILDTKFVRNSVVGVGSAVSVTEVNTTLVAVNCSFDGNVTTGLGVFPGTVGGGAVSISDSGEAQLTNCIIAGNISESGGAGVVFSGGSPSGSLVNCTIVGNRTPTTDAAGVRIDGGAGPGIAIVNSLLWDNASADPVVENQQLLVSGAVSVGLRQSNLQGLIGSGNGIGNSAADPLFLRLPSPGADNQWGTPDDDYGDLRLSPGSPAIDSGDSSIFTPANNLNDIYDLDRDGNSTEALPTDILSFPRFIDDPSVANTGVGAPPVDRGCYESQVNCLTCPGPREWRSPLGGVWDFAGNWFPSIPQSTHDTLFDLASSYSVTLPAAQSVSANSAAFSKGSVTLDLNAGTLSLLSTIAPSLTLGDTPLNTAALSVTNSAASGGSLTAVNARIGSVAGAAGSLTVSGSQSSFTSTRSTCVGCDGAGVMTVSNGGSVLTRDATIGDQPGSSGYVQITGAGSHWDIPFFLIVDHGELNISSGGVVNAGFGVYLFDEGTISGNGTLNGNVVNFGAIAPGNSPGTLTINGSYQQVGQVVGLGSVSGQLRAQAAGAGSGQYDKLVVNGAATLGGGLSLSLLNNYVPGSSDQLQVVSASGGLVKPFDVVFFPALGGQTTSDKYFRAAYSGLRGPGAGSVTVNLGSLATSPSFNSPQQVVLDNPPSTIAVGDLNGDNLPDVAITIPDPINPTGATGVVVVLFNQGGSGQNWQGFAPHLPGDPTTIPPIPVGINPKSAAITNLESSGLKHLLVANAGSNSVSILKLAGTIVNTLATQPTDSEPVGIAATDFTGLGNKSDIVVVACSGGSAASTGSMTMLANTTAGGTVSFIRRNIPAPQGHKPVNPRPFNPDQDKDIDLAVITLSTDGSPDTVLVFANGLNPGAPAPVPDLFNTSGASTSLPVGALPAQALSGKLARVSATNPAGKKEDLVTVNTGGNSISVIVNTTATQDAPTFAPAVEYHFDVNGTTAASPRSGAAVDLDSSGTLDLAIVADNPSSTNRVVKLLRNDSTENLGVTQVAFAQMPDVNAGSKPLALVGADVDGDGQTDLVTINSTSGRDTPNTLQIVRNALGAPATLVGACCNGAACLVLQPAQCAGLGQRFAGYGTSCNVPGVGNTPCCKGDFDQNGTLAVADIFTFLNAWFAASPSADTDDSGFLAVADIFAFLNFWFGGC